MTLRQLRRVASGHNIARYSRMRKSQLLTAIRQLEQTDVVPNIPRRLEAQEEVEAAKFNLGPSATVGVSQVSLNALSSVDEGLPVLPEGYGESRIILIPRDPLWAYVYWDVPNDHREHLRRLGGQDLKLRVYDVTQIDLDTQQPHALLEYACDEMARDWYLPIAVSDRDYLVEIGYTSRDGGWLVLARSTPIHMPPVYPSEWAEEHFVAVQWHDDLVDRQVYVLNPPNGLVGSDVASLGARHFQSHNPSSSHQLQPASSHTNGAGYLQGLVALSSGTGTPATRATRPEGVASWETSPLTPPSPNALNPTSPSRGGNPGNPEQTGWVQPTKERPSGLPASSANGRDRRSSSPVTRPQWSIAAQGTAYALALTVSTSDRWGWWPTLDLSWADVPLPSLKTVAVAALTWGKRWFVSG